VLLRLVALLALLLSTILLPLPAQAGSTSGSGGPLTDRLDVPFTAVGYTSDFHVFAAGLDWSKEVGLLLYTDGSGGYGIDNPNATYLLDADGTAGLVAVAKKHNLLLVTPEAPAPGCDGTDNCWYDSQAVGKANWARAVVDHIYTQYPISRERVVVSGYSSGAQFTTRWFVPAHGAAVQEDGLFFPIAYGGAPAVAATFPASYKAAVHGHWDTGTADSAYSTSSWGAIGGHSWYRANGFQTTSSWPSGVGHSRGGEFDTLLDQQITLHVRQPQAVGTPAPSPAPTPAPTPTPPPAPAPDPEPPASSCTTYCTTVSAVTTRGATLTTTGVARRAPNTYFRLYAPDGSSTYLYTGERPTADVTFRTLLPGTTYRYEVRAGSGRTSTSLRAEGTFTTLRP
jgi:hypothetical protein